jgi:hypothetical protein
MAYTLSHQTPTSTSIEWANVHIVYDGVDYPVADGNTNQKFVFWQLSNPTVLQTSNTYPSLGIEDAIVFINSLGIGLSVLESSVIEGSLVIPGTIQAGALAADSVSADNIVAGAITADKVAADAITANKIAAGAITAEKISASAITADKIAIGSTRNLLSISTWKDVDITPVGVSYNTTGLTNVLEWVAPGTYSFGETIKLEYAGTPADETRTNIMVDDQVFVAPGSRYEASVYLNPHRCAAAVRIAFYNAAGSQIDSALGNVIANKNANGNTLGLYGRSVLFATAPSSAAYAKVFIQVDYDGQANPICYFTRFLLGEATSGATQASAWSSAGGGAGLTVIDGDKITTGSISADKLNVANLAAVSANMGDLTSGTITLDNAGHIKGGQTGYNAGTGFFMGYSGATYKFSIGNSTTGLTWDGAALTVKGNFVAGSISLGTGFSADNNGTISIKSASSGARLEITNSVIKVFDSAGVLRVKIGDLSA